MDRFIQKTLLFSIFPLLSLLVVFLLEDGTTDPFYQRFTTPKQNALILGNSKAAQGIIPAVINEDLGHAFSGDLYNYSFTINNSPYGPAYLKSIKKKLAPGEKDCIFILVVDPWSLSSKKHDPNNPADFVENDGFLERLYSVDSSPNIQYLLKWFESQYFEILLSRMVKVHSVLHADGWYETGESSSPESRLSIMVNFYSKLAQESAMSNLRFQYLRQTLDFLKEHGKVVLVRMPLHPKILQIENALDPEFDKNMINLGAATEVEYLNYSNEKDWNLKDGVHLTKNEAKRFSNMLAANLKKNLNFEDS